MITNRQEKKITNKEIVTLALISYFIADQKKYVIRY